MTDPFDRAEGLRLLHLVQRCWLELGWGRAALVGDTTGRIARSLRERALWVDTRTLAELSGAGAGDYDAVIQVGPVGSGDAGRLGDLRRLGVRWLLHCPTFAADGSLAPAARQELMRAIPAEDWVEYPLGVLRTPEHGEFPLLLCRAAEGGRPAPKVGTWAEAWAWVAGLVRPNDQVVLCGADTGPVADHLWSRTEASRIGARRDAGGAIEWLRCRADEPEPRPRHDLLVICAGAHEAPALSGLAGSLIPGGRLVRLMEPAYQANGEDGADLLPEEARVFDRGECRASSWMRSPLGGETVPYRETVFASRRDPLPTLVDFARHYRNPWLVHACIIGRFRLRAAAGLRELALAVLDGAPPTSADCGGALCVLAYRALAEARPLEADLRTRLEQYLHHDAGNAHVRRWQISLCFVAAKLALAEGRYAEAEAGFLRCAGLDFMGFAPHLGTKSVEAAFLAGWLAWQRGGLDAAEGAWRAGLAVFERTRQVPLGDFLVDPDCPAAFEAGDGLREATIISDHAFRCANGLRAVHLRRHRGVARCDQIDRNFQETVLGLQELERRTAQVADERLALLGRVPANWQEEREHAERVRAAHVFISLALQQQLDELSQQLRVRDEQPEESAGEGAPRPDLADCRRLAIVGTGLTAQLAAEALGRRHEITAFFGGYAEPAGRSLLDRPVLALGSVVSADCDAILVAESVEADLLTELRKLGIPSGRILTFARALDRLVIFGAGAGGQQVLDRLPRKEMVLCFADNDRRKHGTLVHGVRVVGPEQLATIDYRYVLVASMYRQEIEAQLGDLGVPPEKVLAVDPTWRPVVQDVNDARRALAVARLLDPTAGEAELLQAFSFGRNSAGAAVLEFEARTLAIGVMLAAAGCAVRVFGAPESVRRRSALRLETTDAAPSGEELGRAEVLVAGRSGWPRQLPGTLRPGHRLIGWTTGTDEGAHVRCGGWGFWYAPPRAWLAAAPN